MQGAGCSEAKGEQDLTKALERERAKEKIVCISLKILRKENKLKRTERDFSSQFIYLTKSKRCDIIKKLQRRNENFEDATKRTESSRTSRNVKNIHKKFT